jgi:hypothetical protein
MDCINFNDETMFSKLKEASKQQIKKGAYQLSFDESTESVLVLDSKNGELNYVVTGDNDEMLNPTIVYFGLKSK